MALPDIFNQSPLAFAGLTAVVVLLLYYQRTLSWAEYRRLHALKVRVLPYVDNHTDLFVISEKGGYNDAEYLHTVDAPVTTVFTQLRDGGGSPHLINSVKVRPHPDGRGPQYSAAHLVWTHDDGSQTEAYLFGFDTGVTDVYVHHEPGVANVDKHLSGKQVDGDPRGVVRDALGLEEA